MRLRTRRVGQAVAVAAAVLASAGSGLLLKAELPQSVGTWAPVGTVADSRVGAAAVALSDGRTAIAGGTKADGTPTSNVTTYDPAANSFTSLGHLIGPRVGHTATLLKDGRVLVAGGTVDALISADLELFDPSSGSSTLAALMTQPRTGHSAARLADGKVLIAGGATTDGVVLRSAEVFDPATGTVTIVPSNLQVGRAGASATTLIDGRVLVAGGSDGSSDLGSAEIYDGYSQTFTIVGTQLSLARSGHTALLLPHNNSVLISGGTSAGVRQPRADLFLPAEFPDPYSYGTGWFAPTGGMNAARSRAISGPASGEGYAFVMGGGAADAEAYRFATIKTDKDDYAPGEPAIITGTGWQPGEVTLLFQEDPAVHADYVLTVTADSAGNIFHDQWAPEEHDLNVRFYLMAKQGDLRAQTTFTDSRTITSVTLNGGSSVTVAAGASITAVVTATLTGNGNNDKWQTTGWRIATTAPGATGDVTCVNTADLSANDSPASQTFTITAPSTAGTYSAYFVAFRGPTCTWDILGDDAQSNTFTLINSVTVTAVNQAPTIAADNPLVTVGEGQTAANTGTYNDTNTSDNVTITASVGTVTKTGTNTGTWSWSYATSDGPDNSQTVTITANDGNGGVSTTTFALTVNNAAPTVLAGDDATINEGSTFSQSGSFTDPGADTWTATVDYGDGSGVQTLALSPAKTFSLSHLYADNGPYTVTVTVTDSDGTPGTDTVQVTVNNVAPSVAAGADATIDEGNTFTGGGSFTDPGADTWTATVDYGDGSGSQTLVLNPDKTFALSHLYADNGVFTVTVTVTDDDGGAGVDTVQVTVTNLPPTANAGADQSGAEGSPLNFLFSCTDPGTADTWTASVNWGDTTVQSLGSVTCNAGTFGASHAYGDNGIYTVTLTVTDDDGDAGTDTATATVANVAPTVAAGSDAVVNEGSTFSQSGSFIDPGADTWTATVDYDDGGGSQPLALNPDKTFALSHVYADNGVYTVTVTVTDDDGGAGTDSVQVTVQNVAPTVAAGPDATINEGSTFSSTGSFTDPGADTWTATVDYADGSGVQPLALNADKTFSLNHLYPENGIYTVTVRVTDDDGGVGTDTVQVTVNNVPPIPYAGTDQSGTEGSALNFVFSCVDPGVLDTWAASVNWGDGFTQSLGTVTCNAGTFGASHTYSDNGSYTVTLTVIDDDGGVGSDTATVTIANVAPVIVSVSAVPAGPIQILTPTSIRADFTDAGTLDTHTCTFEWDDTTSSSGVVTEAGGSGYCIGTHIYATAGVYTVKVTVTDDDGGSTFAYYQYVVVFDPSAGFVTGGGWINSPQGAYLENPLLSGKANFGFVSKYQRGAKVPTGQTEFQFKAGNMNFHSSSYDWLVVAGAKAQYKGLGTINGGGAPNGSAYKFLLTATDGQVNGGGGVDKFRIKIWYELIPGVPVPVYDNVLGSVDDDIDTTPTQALGGGSIVVHSK